MVYGSYVSYVESFEPNVQRPIVEMLRLKSRTLMKCNRQRKPQLRPKKNYHRQPRTKEPAEKSIAQTHAPAHTHTHTHSPFPPSTKIWSEKFFYIFFKDSHSNAFILFLSLEESLLHTSCKLHIEVQTNIYSFPIECKFRLNLNHLAIYFFPSFVSKFSTE